MWAPSSGMAGPPGSNPAGRIAQDHARPEPHHVPPMSPLPRRLPRRGAVGVRFDRPAAEQRHPPPASVVTETPGGLPVVGSTVPGYFPLSGTDSARSPGGPSAFGSTVPLPSRPLPVPVPVGGPPVFGSTVPPPVERLNRMGDAMASREISSPLR